jgi:hypothetical protein
MELTWSITDDDVAKVQSFMATHADDALVRYRVKRNLTHRPTKIHPADFWHSMVACLLTTQQRSGPKSPVTRFLNGDPFPLALADCRTCSNLRRLVEQILTDFGGIRRGPTIANELTRNLQRLEERYWSQVDVVLDRLIAADDPTTEREAARFIDHVFLGFGPKQSRNLLQMLGLTRYEIPLDSRVAKWFNQFGFPIYLSAGALGDESVYDFVSDGIQLLCRRAAVYPCVLDAAVFASFDGDGWKELGDIIW